MKYTYLVCYNIDGTIRSGFFQEFITVDEPINTEEKLAKIQDHLKKEDPKGHVYWFKLRAVSLMGISMSEVVDISEPVADNTRG